MATPPGSPRSRRVFLAAVGIATALAVWLRTWGITGQLVIDDEWHAIHKLIEASYSGIFKTFGLADHSIPLTLFYKWMANAFGLAEGRLRVPQVICGVALVPICAWIALAATRDRAAAALFAFLVSGAPFLVLWSRFARPYAISLLLVVLCIACIWRWRSKRTNALAACAAITAALATWFHPLAGMYPALACVYVFVEDLRASPGIRATAWRQSFKLSAGVAAAMSALLIYPLYKDSGSLAAKSGGDHPNFDTYDRMLSIIWGGLPQPLYAAALAATAWGFVMVLRRDRALGGFLAVLAISPAVVLTITGAVWIFVGQAFARYQLPLLLLLLFFGSIGAVSAVRALAGKYSEIAAWIASLALSAVYLAATPAIEQVATLGAWYAHTDYHWDYRQRWLDYKRGDPGYGPPAFYRKLEAMPPGSAPIVQAPYVWEAPNTPLDYYAIYHHQPEWFGMLHDLCRHGPRLGEVPPNDRRFRFRRFVFLDNPAQVRGTGARYLIYNWRVGTRFSPQDPALCIRRLTDLYGPPAEEDQFTVVWDLKR